MNKKIIRLITVILSILLLVSLTNFSMAEVSEKDAIDISPKPKPIIHKNIFNLPKEAPHDYYTEQFWVNNSRSFLIVPTKLEWLNIYIIDKIDEKDPSKYSDSIITLSDNRTGTRYGRSRIITIIHLQKEKVIFSTSDTQYTDSEIGQKSPSWVLPSEEMKVMGPKFFETILEYTIKFIEASEKYKKHHAI